MLEVGKNERIKAGEKKNYFFFLRKKKKTIMNLKE